MTDESIMPFGKFKGRKMANVPCFYLLLLHENKYAHGELKLYIESNLQVLKLEAERYNAAKAQNRNNNLNF